MKHKIFTSLLLAILIVLAITSQTVVQTEAEGRGSSDKNAASGAEFVPGEIIVRFRDDTTAKKQAHRNTPFYAHQIATYLPRCRILKGRKLSALYALRR